MGRDKYARQVELGSSAVAGSVGVALGAEKLRDAYKRDYPAKYAHGATQVERAAGDIAPKAGRIARVARTGHVGFVPLVVGTAAAATATGTKRYRKRRALQETAQHPVVKSAFGVEHIAKGHQITLDATNTVDATVRRLKRKTLPSVTQIVARAGDRTRDIVANEQTKLAKAYDPDRGARRRERGAEGVLGAGATAAAIGAGRSANQGHLRRKAAGTSAAARDQDFASARRNMGSHIDHLHDTAKAKRQRKAVPVGRLEDSANDARHVRANLSSGQRHHAASIASARDAGSAFRRARNLRVSAAGLGVGAIVAHRRAGSHDR